MAEANKDEVEKCKQIAQSAMAAGDTDKASRFLQKAKRMCPGDASIDALLQQAASGGGGAGGGGESSAGSANTGASAEGARFRGAASARAAGPASAPAGAARTNKDGRSYTPEQMQLVQRILRTKDYYDILEVPRDSNEDAVKRSYKKLALKLHPDKNKAPGAEEAFKKLSKAVQCLSDADKKNVYDRYGDEDRIPQQQRHHYQQDFMTAEDLFSAFFGGGGATFHTYHHGQRQQHHHHHDEGDGAQVHRAQLFQALPIILLVLLTLASNFASRDGGSRFSFSMNGQYRNERSTTTLGTQYYVTNNFEEHYPEGTRTLSEFERQVEIYHVRHLHSECDNQEKAMYKKVMIAKRRGSQEELKQAREHPRPACKQIEKIKRKHSNIYRAAMYMGY
mmetsp:Transcript_589/g.1437  ORF Transcript_589/g.1437 Transcript_589/m.1437 type:complete len:393 (-) Transcript_589:129-1307(-)